MATTTEFDRVRLTRAPRVRSLRLGDLRITYVPDGLSRLKPRGWLPAATDADWAAYHDHLDDGGFLVAGIGGLLVERGDRALLIDAGFGPESHSNDPIQPGADSIYGGELLDNLRRLGREPSRIEAVAITHLHTDHLGWAWSPPGADRARRSRTPPTSSRHPSGSAATSTRRAGRPSNAGRLRAPRPYGEDGEEIFPGVRASVRPGHTVGHADVHHRLRRPASHRLRRRTASRHPGHSPRMVLWRRPRPRRSAEHRRRLVARAEPPDTIGYGLHFADVVFGRTERRSDGRFTWIPVA